METSQTAERAFAILESFTGDNPRWTGSELSRELGLQRTITARLLNTLEGLGYLMREIDGTTFSLHTKSLEMGVSYVSSHPFSAHARRAAQSLASETGIAVHMGLLSGDQSLMVYHQPGTSPVRVSVSIGARQPATTSALGKAILMHLTNAQRVESVGQGPFPLQAKNSLTTTAALFADLDRSRERGWSTSIDEAYEGISAVGAAIINVADEPVLGMSLSWPTLPDNDLKNTLGPRIAAVANGLSTLLSKYETFGGPFSHIDDLTRSPLS